MIGMCHVKRSVRLWMEMEHYQNDDFQPLSFECGLERFEKDSAKRTRRKDQHHHEKCCIEISVANSFLLSTQMHTRL